MNSISFTFYFILGITGLAIAAKVMVYVGTIAFYDARHRFYSQFKEKEK